MALSNTIGLHRLEPNALLGRIPPGTVNLWVEQHIENILLLIGKLDAFVDAFVCAICVSMVVASEQQMAALI